MLKKILSMIKPMKPTEVRSEIQKRRGLYEMKIAKNGKYYFVLKAANGEQIAKSQMYSSKQAAENGIKSIRRYAPIAKLV
jgi:uncharacterized protein